MRLVLSTGDVIFCFCAIATALYTSPFFIDKVNDNASNDWEFLHIWDDKENFLDNEVIANGLSLTNLYTMFTMTKINVYEPFGWLLKAIQVQVVGLDSWWVRVVSAALHFMAATVLARTSAVLLDVIALLSDFRSGVAINSKAKQQREKGNWYGCCISAVVFAIHPVHVEVIGWPSAQPYTLCALFSNFALYVYVRAVYRELSGVSIGKKNVKVALMSLVFDGHGRSDLLCCGLYGCALLSKSVCILLPSGFVFTDMLVFATLQPLLPRPSVRQCCSYIVGKLPIAATLLTFLVVMLRSNHSGMQAFTDVLSLTLTERVLKATTMPAWVLRRILWPTKLRPHYQLHSGELSLSNPEYLLSLSASMALASFTVWMFRYRHAPQHLLALAYFAIVMLPVSGLIQHGMVSAGCDRYAYLCSIVIVPYLGNVLAQCCFNGENDVEAIKDEKSTQPKHHQPMHDNPGAVGAVLLLVGTLLSISTSLMGLWRNEDALLEYSLRMDPTDWRILDQRASFFINSGRHLSTDEACRELWILSHYFTPMGTLKADLHRLKMRLLLKKVEGICETYQELLDANPDNCHLHNNVGVCLINQRKLSDARQAFELALQSPGNEELHAMPRWNLEALDQWITLKEEAQAQGEEDTLPQLQSQIMY